MNKRDFPVDRNGYLTTAVATGSPRLSGDIRMEATPVPGNPISASLSAAPAPTRATFLIFYIGSMPLAFGIALLVWYIWLVNNI